MNNAPLLIVTPTLGDSPFLDATVQSLQVQRFAFRHVLAVPAAKVDAMRRRYSHATVVPDAGRSGGIYGALNAALDAVPAGWSWFTYINDDDLLSPALSRVVRRHLARPRPEPVVYGEVGLIDETDRRVAGVTIERSPTWIPGLLQSGISPLMQQGTLFAHDLVQRVGRFDLRYKLCADLDFWLRCYATGAPFRHYPQEVARFRLRTGQLSADTARTRAEQDEIVARHLPAAVPAWQRAVGLARFRVCNLPKYLARFRRHGLRRSYAILGGDRRPLLATR